MAMILVVDDRIVTRSFLTTLLGHAGHTVWGAKSGAAGLKVARERKLDLVITDVQLPGMDGREFVRQLRANAAGANIPTIFYTASDPAGEACALAAACSMAHVLAKPAPPQEILDRVAVVLSGSPATSTPRGGACESLDGLDEATPLYLQNLAELQQTVHKALEQGVALLAERGSLGQTSRHLVHSFDLVQHLNLRLAAVLELGLSLPAVREPQALLEHFCRSAQDIMNCGCVGVGLLDPGRRALRRWAANGVAPATCAEFAGLDPCAGVFGEVLESGLPCWLSGLLATPDILGLPASHPHIDSILVVPIEPAPMAFGWLYFANKAGAAGFDAEDLRFAVTLESLLALSYRNLEMYDEIQGHVAQLEAEMLVRKHTESALSQSMERFRQLAENIHEVFYLVDPAGSVLYISPMYEVVWQRSRLSLYENSSSWIESIVPEDRERVLARLALQQITAKFDCEYRIARPDGSQRWIRSRGFPILNEAGEPYRMAGIAEDITERKEQQDKISRLSRIHAMLGGINAAMLRVCERDKLFLEACRIAVEAGGFQMAWVGVLDLPTLDGRVAACYGDQAGEQEVRFLTGRVMRELQPIISNDIASDSMLVELKEFAARGYGALAVFPLLVENRAAAVMALGSSTAGCFDDEEVKLLSELAADISYALQFIEQQERLDYLAYYDPLTKLPNRTLLQDRLAQLLFIAKRGNGKVALVVLDICRFVLINETHGRHAGDLLLSGLAERLALGLVAAGSAARLSDNTFAVVALVSDSGAAVALCEQLFALLEEPFLINGHSCKLAARLGVALYPADADNAENILKKGEMALKQAKAAGERYCFYSAEINESLAAKLQMEERLLVAIEQQQFVLHFQPKVDLKSGAIVGAEALIRWQCPQYGLLAPGQFIAQAEECGLIVPIGEWLFDAVCAQQAAWLADGIAIVPVALNVSALQFKQGQVLQIARAALRKHGLAPHYLGVELTETAMICEPVEVAESLAALHDLGVSLSLDDFGTGYSSLAYLKDFPFDIVKIDRSFITDITRRAEDAAIAKAVIGMAHSLRLKVVAEGVETEAQLNYLRRHGCDQIQGYYFSTPLPAEKFAALLCDGKRMKLAKSIAPNERVLLAVDGDADNLRRLQHVLQHDGVRLLLAASVEQGLELLALNAVQVVLSEECMSAMSGSEFLNVVGQLYPDTIRIILTGDTDLQTVIDVVNEGAVYKFLTKPWRDDILREHIRDAFLHYRPADRSHAFYS